MERSELEQYRVKKPNEEKFDLEQYRVKRPPLYQTHPKSKLIPIEEFEETWKRRDKDPEERKVLLDETSYAHILPNGKQDGVGNAYTYHKPTWLDRGKELTQGLAAGTGNIADIASNYVAAPITWLGSKAAIGLKRATKYTDPDGAKEYKKLSKDLQSLSDKYWNQNLSKEWKNADILKTKNRDNTAAMLRGAGEFAPDLIPVNLVGKGVRLAAGASKAASPAVKGFKNRAIQLWKEPKLPKVANVLETSLTGKNAAGFAGAGVGHGYINTDNWGDKDQKPWWMELPFMMGGAGLASGAYGGVKAANKSFTNVLKDVETPEKLSMFRKWLANRINSGDNKLDEKFINLAKDSGSDLNAFNIYKDNKVPFTIARRNPTENYLELLPKMKENIHNKTLNMLDSHYVPYDKNNPKSDLSYSANAIASKLKSQYKNLKNKSDTRYEMSDMFYSPSDSVNPENTMTVLKDLYGDTLTPLGKGSGIGKLNNIVMDLATKIHPYKKNLPLNQLLNQKRALMQIMSSAPAEIGGLKSREITLLQKVIDAIDVDIATNSKIENEKFLPFRKQADSFYAEHIVPFKKNKVFKRLNEDLNIEDAIINAASDKNRSAELKKILDINETQDKAFYSPSRTIFRDIIKEFETKKNTKTDEEYNKLARLAVKEFGNKGKGKGKGKGAADIIEHDRNYIDDTKSTLDWIKRLETEKRLIADKYTGDYNVEKLLDEINVSHLSDLYKPELSKDLRKNISPYGKKYLEIKQRDKKYKSGLVNTLYNSDHYGNKYDITKHIHNWPTIVGGGIGSLAGGNGTYMGGLVGAAFGAGGKHLYSKAVFNAMTDKQFVDELIKMGRLPKETKQQVLFDIKKRPVLKTEIIRLMFEKRDEKNN